MRKTLKVSLVVAAMVLSLLRLGYAAEPLSISHQLAAYTDNGPTATLDFVLDITNNSDIALLDAQISLVPVGFRPNRLLRPVTEQSPVFIGDIPVAGNMPVDYTMQSIPMFPEDELNDFPLLWEVRYTDTAGQEQFIIVESLPQAGS